jgi:hypothetical protein
MLNRLLPACLLAAALAAANGCCCSHPFIGHGPGVIDTCASGDCGECASCGTAAYPGHLLHGARRAATCGAGCGDMYWGDWLSYPPTCGDPCDDGGDWIGGYCCSPWHIFSGLRYLWGYRVRPCGCGVADCDGGCASCATGYSSSAPAEMFEERSGEQLAPPTPEPEPAPARKATETSHRIRSAAYAKAPTKTTTKSRPRTNKYWAEDR